MWPIAESAGEAIGGTSVKERGGVFVQCSTGQLLLSLGAASNGSATQEEVREEAAAVEANNWPTRGIEEEEGVVAVVVESRVGAGAMVYDTQCCAMM